MRELTAQEKLGLAAWEAITRLHATGTKENMEVANKLSEAFLAWTRSLQDGQANVA